MYVFFFFLGLFVLFRAHVRDHARSSVSLHWHTVFILYLICVSFSSLNMFVCLFVIGDKVTACVMHILFEGVKKCLFWKTRRIS